MQHKNSSYFPHSYGHSYLNELQAQVHLQIQLIFLYSSFVGCSGTQMYRKQHFHSQSLITLLIKKIALMKTALSYSAFLGKTSQNFHNSNK